MENEKIEQLTASKLHSQIHFLTCRIHELEIQNAKLLSQLAHCHCSKVEERIDSKANNGDVLVVDESGGEVLQKKVGKSKKKRLQDSNARILRHLPKRYIALKVMYFGLRFYGFASEAQTGPTVESELFKAFEKARLLVGDRKESHYSRCGRTDKGVSAAGQVIALYLRSNLKAERNSEGVVSEEQYEGEINYVRTLNRVLPKDIRIIGWCPVPVDFHARFSCLSRKYKYFFWNDSLDILAMQKAGKKLLGEHDFRNFCKMDAVNVHNYKRYITSFDIVPCGQRFRGKELWAVTIVGSAFLWHQVRCMVEILFMVGRGLETADIVDVLLDIERTPKKPQYIMAPEVPLVLHSCEFRNLQFFISADARNTLTEHLENECRNLLLQAAILGEALDSNSLSGDEGKNSIIKEAVKKKSSHVPLVVRSTEPSYEERRAKLNASLKRDFVASSLGVQPTEK